MQDTDHDRRPTPLHRTASAGLLALTVLLPGAAVADERNVAASRRTHALLVNGGKSPSNNMLSHLHHLQDMVESLSLRGIPLERISIFSSDGENPEADLAVRGGLDARLWMLPDTLAARYLRRPVLTNTVWDAVSLRPATLAELRQWFEKAGRKLDTGDTLLVFVTDHGTDNKEDPPNGFIELWKESLSVLEFRALLGYLKPGVRVINLMSQCFSGGFAQAMAPLGARCGRGNRGLRIGTSGRRLLGLVAPWTQPAGETAKPKWRDFPGEVRRAGQRTLARRTSRVGLPRPGRLLIPQHHSAGPTSSSVCATWVQRKSPQPIQATKR